jgi:hypothetical protein
VLSLHEGESRAGYRNVVLDQKLDAGQSPGGEEDYVIESVNLGTTVIWRSSFRV